MLSLRMSEWTLGAVKAQNMELLALCEAEGCNHLFAFDLDALIEGAGADFRLADIPPMQCPQCGMARLSIRLSFPDPPDEGD